MVSRYQVIIRLTYKLCVLIYSIIQVLRVWYEAIEATAGSVEECAKLLENNELLAISPGGDREMCFSDENYTLVWQERKGFAKVAIQAKSVILN